MALRVLGVDPGLTRCGLGVVDVQPNRSASLVAVGVVGSSSELPLSRRLLVISESIDEWLDAHAPDVLAVERVFSQTNLSTVMGVAQASGIVIAAAAKRGLPVAMHTPSEVKAAVTGNGRADKAAVTMMVTRILKLAVAPSPADAADALALAITHAWRSGPGSTSALGELTPARKLWLEAEAKARKNAEKSSRQRR
ncbi:crossover junction endodeoxyribonuclease RuvC [Arthrobacter russicus]|uniref:Crossover junction endodeoxyribonuclease RuvC n=1 Tax=Arthrobacter russicus TaxID=172040 RepID=A0ABU1J7N8_9MICC|nr:crossover junction endodeoxyribonuclease RuvC [Arthrobacter russicus]MBQ1442734.1 crossover junction endodeoxyribonuclease RuvC [Renibacterium sp.]MDR6267871.1 crossover junction endodeoxyribonuclease RuvC [Arthrobacter russicus]